MNTPSNGNDNLGDCFKKTKEIEKKKEAEVLLKCGTSFPATVLATTPTGTNITLSTLTLNTSHFCDPCIKFEFASNIVTTAAIATINFQIFRLCKYQISPTPIGAIWTFATTVATTDARTFTFILCDCDFCPEDDCCTYSVVATVIDSEEGTVAINNPILSALVVEDQHHRC